MQVMPIIPLSSRFTENKYLAELKKLNKKKKEEEDESGRIITQSQTGTGFY